VPVPAVTDNAPSAVARAADAAARATPPPAAQRLRGLSDRAIAWIFIAPTIVLLLAITSFR
jgi:multiple sugar transport system permease protein